MNRILNALEKYNGCVKGKQYCGKQHLCIYNNKRKANAIKKEERCDKMTTLRKEKYDDGLVPSPEYCKRCQTCNEKINPAVGTCTRNHSYENITENERIRIINIIKDAWLSNEIPGRIYREMLKEITKVE